MDWICRRAKRSGLASDQRAEVYRPCAQQCSGLMSLVVRTHVNPAAITRAIRTELDTLDKYRPIENVRTMTQPVGSGKPNSKFVILRYSADTHH
jgi:hypothetical protein